MPHPITRSATTEVSYEFLPEAEEETKAIMETLKRIDGVKPILLEKRDATYDKVRDTLKEEEFQIIHYNGHAMYNTADVTRSSLILHDRDMNARQLAAFVRYPPILCFTEQRSF